MDGEENVKDFSEKGVPKPLQIFKEINAEAFIDRYDTKKLLLGAQRHLIVIIISLVVWGIIAAMFADTLMNTYKADAVVIYQEENKPKSLPGGYTLTSLSLATVLDMIKLPVNFQAVKAILGLDLPPAALDGMVDIPTPRSNSNLIHIVARGDNPLFVVDLANTLAKAAVKSSQEFFQKQLQAALQSYIEQLETNNQKLTYQLQEIENFKKENQYFEMTADYVGMLKLMTDTKSRLQNVTLQYNSLLVEYENMKREVASLPDEVPISSSYGAGYHYSPLEAHLGSLQASLAEARSKYTSDNPKVKQIEDELENLLKQTKQKGVIEQVYEWNTDKTKLQIDLLRMQGKVRATLKMKQDLMANVSKLEKELETLPSKQIVLSKLFHSKEITEEQQKFLYGAIESVQLMLNIPTGSIDIYALADKGRPLRDSWWVQLLPLFGFFVGFCFGVMIAIIMEMWDTKYRTAKELEIYYNLPCLGVIPLIPDLTRENAEDKTLFFVRMLHERLELYNREGNVKSITFTSSVEGEGKSMIAYYYALYCQRIGLKTILVQCTPREGEWLVKKPLIALEDYLRGNGTYQELIMHNTIDWIKITTMDPELKELIKSDRMKALWAELYLDYDIIVVDSPGVITEEYTVNLVHLSELSVYVVDSSKISKSFLDQALAHFEHFHVKPTGLLLNKVLPVYVDDRRIKTEFNRNKFLFWKH